MRGRNPRSSVRPSEVWLPTATCPGGRSGRYVDCVEGEAAAQRWRRGGGSAPALAPHLRSSAGSRRCGRVDRRGPDAVSGTLARGGQCSVPRAVPRAGSLPRAGVPRAVSRTVPRAGSVSRAGFVPRAVSHTVPRAASLPCAGFMPRVGSMPSLGADAVGSRRPWTVRLRPGSRRTAYERASHYLHRPTAHSSGRSAGGAAGKPAFPGPSMAVRIRVRHQWRVRL